MAPERLSSPAGIQHHPMRSTEEKYPVRCRPMPLVVRRTASTTPGNTLGGNRPGILADGEPVEGLAETGWALLERVEMQREIRCD
jgi:hypothetical protein